jgi:hypothetical protein
MAAFMQCFSVDELLPLDEHQLSLLRFALEREVRNSPEIKRILRASVQPLYDQMQSQRRQG